MLCAGLALVLSGLFAAPVSAQEPCPEPKGGPPRDASGSGFCPPTEPPSGSISANPTVCTIPSGSTVYTSTVSWTSINASSAEVWVFSHATGSNQLFAGGLSGLQSATWISAAGYRFDLKLNGLVFDSVEVRGNPAPAVSLVNSP